MGSTVIQDLGRFGPGRCEPLRPDEAAQYTLRFAMRGRENFHVLSWLLPRGLRADVANVYAYCRWADDLADESGGGRRALELLAWWRDELEACFAGAPRHPVFVALGGTIARHHLPREPFLDLLDAFEQDQRRSRYQTWDELLDYCRRSANPVGRLYLMVCGHRDEAMFRLSDHTCTALQLVNFWQDVRRDLVERDRVYVPQDAAAAHGMTPDRLAAVIGRPRDGDADASAGRAFQALMCDLVGRTWPLFAAGRALLPRVDPRVRRPIALFTLGGEAVLRKIARGGYSTHRGRPRLGFLAKAALLPRAALAPGNSWTEAPH